MWHEVLNNTDKKDNKLHLQNSLNNIVLRNFLTLYL